MVFRSLNIYSSYILYVKSYIWSGGTHRIALRTYQLESTYFQQSKFVIIESNLNFNGARSPSRGDLTRSRFIVLDANVNAATYTVIQVIKIYIAGHCCFQVSRSLEWWEKLWEATDLKIPSMHFSFSFLWTSIVMFWLHISYHKGVLGSSF